MKSFAYIVSPNTIPQLRRLWPFARILPGFLLDPLRKRLPLLKTIHIRGQSIREKHIEGEVIIYPLLPDELKAQDEDFILDKIIEASELAASRGARIIGIAGDISLIADKKYKALAKKLKTPMTNGASFTAWSVFETIYRMSKVTGLDLKNCTLAVKGMRTSLGQLCAKKLAEYINRVVEDNADITVDVTDTLEPQIDLGGTKIKAGLIKLPGTNATIYASLAETMLLALEEKFVHYSWGESINPDRQEEVANIAVKHDFEVWLPEAPVL